MREQKFEIIVTKDELHAILRLRGHKMMKLINSLTLEEIQEVLKIISTWKK